MDNKIIEFLVKENARISNGDKWLVVNEDEETCHEITVYQVVYRKHVPTILYRGYSLDEALHFLGGGE